MTADEALSDFIARLRAYGNGVAEGTAKEAAPLVMSELQRTAAAGTDPYGTPWAPRKKDGARAMPDAALAIDAVARGPVVLMRSFRGVAQNNYLVPDHRRQSIPDGSRPLPPGIVAALDEGATRHFRKTMGA